WRVVLCGLRVGRCAGLTGGTNPTFAAAAKLREPISPAERSLQRPRGWSMRNPLNAPMRPAGSQDVPRYSVPLVNIRYFGLVAGAIVVGALYFGRPVLLPLAISILFAFALAPLVGRLCRIGFGRVVAALIATVVALGLT